MTPTDFLAEHQPTQTTAIITGYLQSFLKARLLKQVLPLKRNSKPANWTTRWQVYSELMIFWITFAPLTTLTATLF